MAPSWIEELQNKLMHQFGNKKGSLLIKKYEKAFLHAYMDDYSPDTAINDIEHIETLSSENKIALNLYLSAGKSEHPLHLRLFQWQHPIPLSHVLPMLENLDLMVYDEHPYKITFNEDTYVWISDFSIVFNKSTFDLAKVKGAFEEAFICVYKGACENDGFNKLVLDASLSWHHIVILRAYTKYLRQIGFRFSQEYIERTLSNNVSITQDLINLFLVLHDPSKQSKAKVEASDLEQSIHRLLENVSSLDEDRIIRQLLALIKATLRTNYFQLTKEGRVKSYISFKLASEQVPGLPLPLPLYEIFVYSPRFEAIHLRSAKVARGGIRWSDRREDFRTEILGLMKAQKVKNSVIVPSGAKGGFVLKAVPPQATREVIQTEVIACYKSFIRSLLDITDNIVDDKFVRPHDVVCYDDIDTYLVVAADKGTATFSDIANDISKEYHFWLDDAFASGGSTGYDHKKMGITARGAWESIKRHFRALNTDVTKTDITAVGIGDMSGDVFGNGMIYSNHIKLIAAFDHRHIFIDPDPIPQISYDERVRLFNLPTSSWEDYNAKLISKGGGVFKRSLKSITLTPQMKQVLSVTDNALAPNDLIKAILKAPVDLLFNGGIGTYVKSEHETNADVGDRTNEYCRVNGNELRCRVVGEGGNLGFTQLGRIEYALNNGLINTDFIDNSAGVDCSDHEVNLKILLDKQITLGKLSLKKRNELLASMTKEVAELVLNDNYKQALVTSFTTYDASRNISLHQTYLSELESQGILNRKVEFLPDDRTILERKAAGEGFTCPELCVLLAYTKIHLKQEILKSNLPEDPYLRNLVETAFPASMRKKYKEAMEDHRLHRDIIATQLSNRVVNEMGITFVYRVQMETGSTVDEIIRGQAVSSAIFGIPELQRVIESLDFKIPMGEQYEMLYNIRSLVNLATRWFLHSTYLKSDLKSLIDHFSVGVRELENIVPELMGGYTKTYLQKLTAQFEKNGLEEHMARHIATYRAIYTTLNIIDVSTKYKLDLVKTTRVYFASGERMNLLWFRDQIAQDTREGHWNTLARLTLRDELDISQRALTVAIMQNDKANTSAAELIDTWMKTNKRSLDRWSRLLELLHDNATLEYTMFFIAIRELFGLIANSQVS